MSIIKVDYGEISGGGNNGTLNITSTSTDYHIPLGFKPKFVALVFSEDYTNKTANCMVSVYDENIDNDNYFRGLKQGSTLQCQQQSLSAPLKSIDSDGFTINIANSNWLLGTWHYFACN